MCHNFSKSQPLYYMYMYSCKSICKKLSTKLQNLEQNEILNVGDESSGYFNFLQRRTVAFLSLAFGSLG